MIEQAVRQTKPLPDFSRSAAHEVFLILSGTIQNPAFLRFIERLGEDALSRLQTLDFLALDALADTIPIDQIDSEVIAIMDLILETASQAIPAH
jgi:ATP-dependent DNA helicase RecG